MSNNSLITKYEKARIIGQRALQLSNGSPPTIDIKNMTNHIEIAKEEFRQKSIPFIIRRNFPDGSFQEFKLEDLDT